MAHKRKCAVAAALVLARDGFKLMMSHFPDLFYDALADGEFDLAVAGHYHGGQIIPPVPAACFPHITAAPIS